MPKNKLELDSFANLVREEERINKKNHFKIDK